MSNIDELLEAEGRAAEAGKDAPLQPGTKVSRGHGRSKTLQIRLNDDEYAALEAMAVAQHLPLSTMVRSLIVASTRKAGEVRTGRLTELRREVDNLTQEIAEVARDLDAVQSGSPVKSGDNRR